MRFSLILPIYNVGHYLDDCLESILNQNFTNYECLLIDDGSNDNSAEICAKFVALNCSFKYYYKDNGGLSDARNYGIDRASGEYIFFVDSDDIISPVALFTINECIHKYSSELIYFDYKKFHAEKNDTIPHFDLNISDNLICQLTDKKLSQKPNFAWARVAKRTMYDDVRFPVGFIYEDVLTSPLLSAHAVKISYIKHELYGYRKRANSITTGSAEKQFKLFETLDLLKDYVCEGKLEREFYTTVFINLIQSCLVSLARIENVETRWKYICLILDKYHEISYGDVFLSYSLKKYKFLTILSKNKITLWLLSVVLREVVLFSDRKGK